MGNRRKATGFGIPPARKKTLTRETKDISKNLYFCPGCNAFHRYDKKPPVIFFGDLNSTVSLLNVSDSANSYVLEPGESNNLN
jgi:hypothetical protein